MGKQTFLRIFFLLNPFLLCAKLYLLREIVIRGHQLFAVSEVVQELLGFNPVDLMFVQTVQTVNGLKPLYHIIQYILYMCDTKLQNLLDYVWNFLFQIAPVSAGNKSIGFYAHS